MIGLVAALDRDTCSRAECRENATWRIDWSNPKIHTDGRTKTWLACAVHIEFLRDFLAARDFPLSVRELGSEPAESS